MSTRIKYLLFSGLFIGSLWAFSEVVLGSVLRAEALRMRGTLLTGIGVVILFVGFAYTRQVWSILFAVFTTVIARILFASSFGFGISVTNGSLAVLITGVSIVVALKIIRSHPSPGNFILGFTAAVTIVCSGTLFYIVGSRFYPCPYLKQFTAFTFFLKETILWGLFSAAIAPTGYRAGIALAYHSDRTEIQRLPAWCIVVSCWLCCGLTVILTS